MAFFPATDALGTTPASPDGFVAVSFPPRHPKNRSTYPAGVWTRVEVGVQTYWLEGHGLISSSPMQFDVRPGAVQAAARRKVLLSPMVRADTVVADVGQASEDSVVRFYHFDSHSLDSADLARSGLQPEFVRQETLSQARSGVLLPSGTAIAGLWDERRKQFSALSRPGRSVGGKQQLAIQPPPVGSADVFVTLLRPEPLAGGEPDDSVPVLVDVEGVEWAPDAVVRSSDKIRAVFYDRPSGGAAKLRVRSTGYWAEAQDLPLHSQAVEHLDLLLAPKPQLRVTLEVPKILEDEPRIVTLKQQGRELLEQGVEGRQVDLLSPPTVVTVTAFFGAEKVAREVDLSDGLDSEVTIRPDIYAIEGTVFYGDEPHAASLQIPPNLYEEGDPDRPRVQTNEEGDYSTYVTSPGGYGVWVRLDGRDFDTIVSIEVTEPHGVFDLHFPANDYRFHVTDAESGEPIQGAYVVAHTEDGENTISTRGLTDADGWSRAAPLNPGVLTYVANAEGYQPGEPRDVDVVVSEFEVVEEFEIRLRAEGPAETLYIQLADGSPAQGAEVRLSRTSSEGWIGATTGLDGMVEIPERLLGSVLLVNHRGAAVTARVFEKGRNTWILGPAGPPLTIRAVTSASDIFPHSPIILWIDGIRLMETDASFFGQGKIQVDQDGLWTLPNPPTADVAVLVYTKKDPTVFDTARAGGFDSQATHIRYPWPVEVLVEPIQ